MKKLVLFCLILIAGSVMAQDIHFSQYQMSPLNLNPAAAGTDASAARGNINYRSQWSAFGKPFQTMGASFDMGLLRKPGNGSFLGAGFNVFQDKAGSAGLSKLSIGGNLSSVILMSKKTFFSLGVQISYNQRAVSFGDAKWDSQFNGTSYNAGLPSGEGGSMSTRFFDFGAGLAYVIHGNSSNLSKGDDFSMNVGASVFHINRPNQAFQGSDRMNMRYNGYAMFTIGMGSSNLQLQPQLAYWKQGGLQEINVGTYFRYLLKPESQYTGFERGMAVSFGAFYRVKDAVYPAFMFEFGDWAIGVSYDINLSSLTPYSQSRGGMEISLRFRDINGTLFGGSTQYRSL